MIYNMVENLNQIYNVFCHSDVRILRLIEIDYPFVTFYYLFNMIRSFSENIELFNI